MPKITKDEIDHLAQLARVSLSEAESDQLVDELSIILEYIEQLKSLDTKGVEPTYQFSDASNVWREDEVDEELLSREALLATAPSVKDNQIKVPKVL